MSEQASQAPVLESEESMLAYTHSLRKSFIRAKVVEGKFPDDTTEQKNVLTALKHIDDAALSRKRIKVEEKAADAAGANAAIIGQLLQATAGKRAGQGQVVAEAREVPALGPEVPSPLLVEGETASVGVVSDSYEAFVAKQAPVA